MYRRRSVVTGMGVLLTGGLSGCVAAGGPDDCRGAEPVPPEGLRVANRRGTAVTVSVTILQEFLVHTRTALEETYDLTAASQPDGAEVIVEDVVTTAGPHIVEATVESEPPAKRFWQVTTDRCEAIEVLVVDGGVSISDPY